MKKFKEEYCVYGFLTVVFILAAILAYQEETDKAKAFFLYCVGISICLGVFISLINFFLAFIPWKIKISAKTKTPIYRIQEWRYNEEYNLQKWELKYGYMLFTAGFLMVPFLSLFHFQQYEKVYDENVEVKLHEIGDLAVFVENMILFKAREKAEKEERLKKKQEPLDKLNQEFNENYFRAYENS